MKEQPPAAPSLIVVPPSLVLAGGVLFFALLYHRHDLIILSLLVLGAAAAAKAWARASFAGLVCRLSVDRRKAFPGEALRLRLEAENRRLLPVLLRVTVPAGGLLDDARRALTGEGGLLWYQKADFGWDLTASRRGVHLLGPHHLATGDLFGFFSTEGTGTEVLQIVVFPRIVPLRHLPLPRRDFFGIPGAESPVKDPVYILGTREYQHGRPARYIHWKASARHQRLQEKLFEPTEQEKVLLAVDVEAFADQEAAEDFERMLEAAASLAVHLDRDGYAVGLVVNGTVTGGKAPAVPIGRGPDQLPSILEVLARLDRQPAAALLDVMRRGVPLPWGVSCVGFARDAQGGVLPAVESLLARRIPVILFVSKPAGGAAARGRGPVDIRPLDALLLEGTPE